MKKKETYVVLSRRARKKCQQWIYNDARDEREGAAKNKKMWNNARQGIRILKREEREENSCWMGQIWIFADKPHFICVSIWFLIVFHVFFPVTRLMKFEPKSQRQKEDRRNK